MSAWGQFIQNGKQNALRVKDLSNLAKNRNIGRHLPYSNFEIGKSNNPIVFQK